MHIFYQLFDNTEYNDAFVYSFGFNGYYNLLYGLSVNISDLKLNKTTFKKKDKNKKDKKDKNKKDKDKTISEKPVFKKMYYPKFINDSSVVTNDCCLDKNMIITGPNASGKTTMLKSAFINILLSQQIGFGCFESLDLHPYDDFHCYLNIPDTSGRDSLFQAEARQCKEIIDSINEGIEKEGEDLGEKEGKTHFCIFDELYSGTNPDEAILSAKSFMDYIVKNDNVTCLLTTHYTKLCKKLAKNKRIQNFSMKTVKKNDSFEYTYKLVEGISKIKGGLKVLKDMNYPKEILSAF
jgi:DNA mismatch repair ATPase MutS